MTRKALARRIARVLITSQQRGEAPAPPHPGGLRGFWPGALLLVGQRPQRVFSLLAPRTQPKCAAALLYEPQTRCTSAH
jgi:DNA-binding helix-hairpin-helix protein with protein kinase domain